MLSVLMSPCIGTRLILFNFWPLRTKSRFLASFCRLEVLSQCVDDKGLRVGITLPDDCACALKSVFRKQLAVLKGIIEVDARDSGGHLVSSWFPGAPPDVVGGDVHLFEAIMSTKSEQMFRHVQESLIVGDKVQVDVMMPRHETVDNAMGRLTLKYNLIAKKFLLLPNGTIPRKGQGYSCDWRQPAVFCVAGNAAQAGYTGYLTELSSARSPSGSHEALPEVPEIMMSPKGERNDNPRSGDHRSDRSAVSVRSVGLYSRSQLKDGT
ncbi:hypothetical protein B0H11DRAFT_1907284 [Mycena galericulata]|nr:hypothetical protein B0H11DRAFT_1907284 [Mycena galericulata]